MSSLLGLHRACWSFLASDRRHGPLIRRFNTTGTAAFPLSRLAKVHLRSTLPSDVHR